MMDCSNDCLHYILYFHNPHYVMVGEEAQVWPFRVSFLLIFQRAQDAKCYLRRAKPFTEAADAVQHCSFCCASTLTMEARALGTESALFTLRSWHFS